MITLARSLQAWKSAGFKEVLQAELEGLDIDLLPLQQGMRHGGHVAGEDFSIMVLNAAEAGDAIRARVGVFYASIIAGCSCADDPIPVSDNAEYCELYLWIDRRTGETRLAAVAEILE